MLFAWMTSHECDHNEGVCMNAYECVCVPVRWISTRLLALLGLDAKYEAGRTEPGKKIQTAQLRHTLLASYLQDVKGWSPALAPGLLEEKVSTQKILAELTHVLPSDTGFLLLTEFYLFVFWWLNSFFFCVHRAQAACPKRWKMLYVIPLRGCPIIYKGKWTCTYSARKESLSLQPIFWEKLVLSKVHSEHYRWPCSSILLASCICMLCICPLWASKYDLSFMRVAALICGSYAGEKTFQNCPKWGQAFPTKGIPGLRGLSHGAARDEIINRERAEVMYFIISGGGTTCRLKDNITSGELESQEWPDASNFLYDKDGLRVSILYLDVLFLLHAVYLDVLFLLHAVHVSKTSGWIPCIHIKLAWPCWLYLWEKTFPTSANIWYAHDLMVNRFVLQLTREVLEGGASQKSARHTFPLRLFGRREGNNHAQEWPHQRWLKATRRNTTTSCMHGPMYFLLVLFIVMSAGVRYLLLASWNVSTYRDGSWLNQMKYMFVLISSAREACVYLCEYMLDKAQRFSHENVTWLPKLMHSVNARIWQSTLGSEGHLMDSKVQRQGIQLPAAKFHAAGGLLDLWVLNTQCLICVGVSVLYTYGMLSDFRHVLIHTHT
jgi:hypothetical protein